MPLLAACPASAPTTTTTEPRVAAHAPFDPTRPLGEQLCEEPARIVDLVDERVGFYLHVETEAAAEEVKALDYTRHVTGPEATAEARRMTAGVADIACGEYRSEDDSAWLVERPSEARGDAFCVEHHGQAEWSSQYRACLARTPGGWRLASFSEWPDGPIIDEVLDAMRAKALAADRQGLTLYGVAPRE